MALGASLTLTKSKPFKLEATPQALAIAGAFYFFNYCLITPKSIQYLALNKHHPVSNGGVKCFQNDWVLPGLIDVGHPKARFLFSVEQLK